MKRNEDKGEAVHTEEKTNVMRILDKHRIEYDAYCYTDKEALSGIEVARILNVGSMRIFKTLVTVGKSKTYYVFMIPSDKELDLKKAASSVGEKSVSMVKSKELLPLTGYVHGGCSPIGMKKKFITVVDKSASDFDKIIFSAGRIGRQVELGIEALGKIVEFKLENITV
ncbi:hypothetical protein HMPREF9333_00116 [Johnsonella ignava ATCC 51276]|uniref:Cys-tRNA(Pro)/Cys-tRNA(Cys) deacylase n=1 Tax=Johnsonella ignava ATCC 51276 TaxID=679200 RepID=G5GEX8_9FIRM|nr:Cys-tRNA(Pro) deacylase [Johnsonella ignava]EHI56669.1 hypothetical protein HMPREF9333_00116 [Johnsonella ignava ATCC 51276]